MQIAIGIILIISAIFLIVAVLMQHGKSHNLSGTIAGGAETFFGKTKGSTIDKMLSKVTTVVAIIFVVIVIVVYIMQDTAVEEYKSFEDALNTPTVTDTVDTTADTAAEGATEAVTEAATEPAE